MLNNIRHSVISLKIIMTVTQILVKTEEIVKMELTATFVIVFLDTRGMIAKSVRFSVNSYIFAAFCLIFLSNTSGGVAYKMNNR